MSQSEASDPPEPPTLTVFIDPGAADSDTICDLLLSLSALYESMGGSGLKIVDHRVVAVRARKASE